jgi:hypothetical protein
MKKILFFLIVMLGITSCTKKFDQLNTNPSQFVSPDPETILTGAFKVTADRSGTNNINYFWEYGHIIQPPGRYNAGDDGTWNNFYINILGNLRQLKNKYQGNTAYTNRVAIATIWECYTYAYLVGTYGPVAYSHAGDVTPVVLYDDENTIYVSLLDKLKQASDAISLTGDKMSTDVIFSGDLNKWKKFANSLRLRIAIRCQRNLPAESVAAIKDLMANESMLLQSDADDPKLSYGLADGSQNPYFVQYIKNAAQNGNLPVMSDYVFTYFRSYKDPRLDAYFNKSVTPFNLPKDTLTSTADTKHHVVTYTIPHLGAPKSVVMLPSWSGILASIRPFNGATLSYNFSTLPGVNQLPITATAGINLAAADRPFYFMTYAEVCFLKAEAAALGYGGTQTADAYYYAGINANFAFWGLTAAQAATYEAQNGIKWNTAGKGFNYILGFINTSIPNDNLRRIWIQEWLNFFDDGFFDAWCLQRRTQNLSLPPHTGSNTPYPLIPNYANLPDRWPYPTSELSVNPQGVADGTSKLGGLNYQTTTLQFAASRTYPDWNAAPALFDYSFVQKWYGNNIQDLTAAGIKYTETATY